jgi:hypothetical protein
MTTKRSPKGLVTVTAKDVALVSREQFLAMSEDEKFALVQRLSQQAQAKDRKWPNTRQRIADLITFWRKFATALGETAGNERPTDRDATAPEAGIVLDRARAATYVRKQINKVEAYLKRIEHDGADQPAVLAAVYPLVEAALLFATRIHHLTVIDNEPAIATLQAKVQAFKRSQAARSERSGQNRRDWQAQANEIWQRHPDWSSRNVARAIARNDPAANWYTIRRRIKKP